MDNIEDIKKQIRKELFRELNEIADIFSNGFLHLRTAMSHLETIFQEVEKDIDGT